jgi:uncharacterized MAPEG superfamily protein
MTTELTVLVVMAFWTVALSYVPLLGRLRAGGIAWGTSNRDAAVDVPPWVARADRAYRNHLDNLPLFVVAVLVAHVTAHSGGWGATGSVVFGLARVAHSVFYVAGITVVRTLAFWASLVGVGLIVSQLVWT